MSAVDDFPRWPRTLPPHLTPQRTVHGVPLRAYGTWNMTLHARPLLTGFGAGDYLRSESVVFALPRWEACCDLQRASRWVQPQLVRLFAHGGPSDAVLAPARDVVWQGTPVPAHDDARTDAERALFAWQLEYAIDLLVLTEPKVGGMIRPRLDARYDPEHPPLAGDERCAVPTLRVVEDMMRRRGLWRVELRWPDGDRYVACEFDAYSMADDAVPQLRELRDLDTLPFAERVRRTTAARATLLSRFAAHTHGVARDAWRDPRVAHERAVRLDALDRVPAAAWADAFGPLVLRLLPEPTRTFSEMHAEVTTLLSIPRSGEN